MRMRWLDGVVFVYGIILILGGLDGFFLHHSKISLIAGGASGILELVFAYLAPTKPRISRIGSAVVALLIAGKFVPDMMKKQSISIIVLAISSIIVFLCLLGGHFYAMNQKKANAS